MSDRTSTILVAFCATAIACIGAMDRPGGWNDGSRFATVESLVDHHTWAIDNSVFCTAAPYATGECPRGTLDKLFIKGHYYSDKSPVPAVLMAAPYSLWRRCGGPSAAAQPQLFCWLLSLASAGLAYLVSVICIDKLAQRHLPGAMRFAVTASFGLGTIALAYSRSVNNHIFLLAVSSAILVAIDDLVAIGWTNCSMLTLGSLAGLAYTIDLGAGPLIAVGAAATIAWRTRSVVAVLSFGVAALPWVGLHHVITYKIAGTLGPANSHPEFFNWPGCPFTADNLTGSWRHNHIGAFLLYAIDMLVGKRGFLGHDLALYLAIPAAFTLVRKRHVIMPEVLLCTGWCLSIWLLYAATSNNMSGQCCSVRWFVPMIAPGYYVLIQFLKDRPTAAREFLSLSAIGTAIGVLSWYAGPWSGKMVPGYWFLLIAGIGAWVWAAQRSARAPTATSLRRAA